MRRGVPALALIVTVGLTGTASAATYEVTKRGDHAPGACTRSDCTLREAVLAANATVAVADKVLLPSRKRYTLAIPGLDDGGAMGDIDITNNRLTIIHRGKGRATVDANGLDRVFDAYAPASLKRLKVIGGASDYGGGVRASTGSLTIAGSIVSGNTATNCGGGIHTQNTVPLVLTRSRVSGNDSASDGGGISASCFGNAGPVRITRSKVTGNRGDSDNSMVGRGGGIYLQTSNEIQSKISKSTFSGNASGPGGGMFNPNEGGGIYTDLGRLRITASTISKNRAGDGGGGISVDGTEPLVIVNSTIASNRANDSGGGIEVDAGTVSMNASTVARNRGNADGVLSETGGGLFLEQTNTFTVENSLIALNTLTALSPGDPPVKNDCAGSEPFVSNGHNLLSTLSLCTGFDGPGDRVRRNPRIKRLKRNGGPTKTVALKDSSPAVGKAKRSSAPRRDQRGLRRDRRPDVGAFELVD